MGTQKNRLNKTVLLSTQNRCLDSWEKNDNFTLKIMLNWTHGKSVICIHEVNVEPLTPSLPYINARNTPGGKIRLFSCYYGVTYNFIQNHNHCRDLHQFFSFLFETFGTMSEIMFSSDSMSKIFFSTAENT